MRHYKLALERKQNRLQTPESYLSIHQIEYLQSKLQPESSKPMDIFENHGFSSHFPSVRTSQRTAPIYSPEKSYRTQGRVTPRVHYTHRTKVQRTPSEEERQMGMIFNHNIKTTKRRVNVMTNMDEARTKSVDDVQVEEFDISTEWNLKKASVDETHMQRKDTQREWRQQTESFNKDYDGFMTYYNKTLEKSPFDFNITLDNFRKVSFSVQTTPKNHRDQSICSGATTKQDEKALFDLNFKSIQSQQKSNDLHLLKKFCGILTNREIAVNQEFFNQPLKRIDRKLFREIMKDSQLVEYYLFDISDSNYSMQIWEQTSLATESEISRLITYFGQLKKELMNRLKILLIVRQHYSKNPKAKRPRSVQQQKISREIVMLRLLKIEGDIDLYQGVLRHEKDFVKLFFKQLFNANNEQSPEKWESSFSEVLNTNLEDLAYERKLDPKFSKWLGSIQLKQILLEHLYTKNTRGPCESFELSELFPLKDTLEADKHDSTRTIQDRYKRSARSVSSSRTSQKPKISVVARQTSTGFEGFMHTTNISLDNSFAQEQFSLTITPPKVQAMNRSFYSREKEYSDEFGSRRGSVGNDRGKNYSLIDHYSFRTPAPPKTAKGISYGNKTIKMYYRPRTPLKRILHDTKDPFHLSTLEITTSTAESFGSKPLTPKKSVLAKDLMSGYDNLKKNYLKEKLKLDLRSNLFQK